MSRIFGLLLAGVGFASVVSMGSSAQAQGFGYGNGFGFNGFAAYPYNSTQTIPYFALYPPVYYSAPIPRTYGYSPFAYPACVMTPELQIGAVGEEIRNPHVPQDGKDGGKDGKVKPTVDARVTMVPAVIYNPYCEESQISAKQ